MFRIVVSPKCLFALSSQRRVSLLLQVVSEESGGKKEQNQFEKKDWHEKVLSIQFKDKERDVQEKERKKDKERERDMGKTAQNEKPGEDFERTPSGRVRRRSAQVAVFHLQEIAEDELAKDWGTKRRIKDDLVPDSKRVRTHIICIPSRLRPEHSTRVHMSGTCGGLSVFLLCIYTVKTYMCCI